MSACPITDFQGSDVKQGSGDFVQVTCSPLGGSYRISGSALTIVEELTPIARAKLAGWVVDQNRLGSEPMVTTNALMSIITQPRMGVMDRVHRLYRFIGHRVGGIGGSLRWTSSFYSGPEEAAVVEEIRTAARAWTECTSDDELDALVTYGSEQKTLQNGKYSGEISLSIAGWHALEKLEQRDGISSQAFVAMWFGSEVSSAYEEGIEPAIKDSGYVPIRIDRKEHANRIDDEIISEIRRSRFVVADFTCGLAKDADGRVVLDKKGDPTPLPRGGVYYEAGFAQGLGIPVIWMCREDHINHVHFDTRQFNHITWTDPADLRKKLKNRIGAVLGDGPNVQH